MPSVRLLVPDDVEELRQLLRECWLDTYTGILPDSTIRKGVEVWQSKESLLRVLQNPRVYYAGYVVNGKLVGVVNASKIERDVLRISQLYVLPAHQRKGIGRQLMDAALGRFPEIHKVVLEVEEGNKKGISFYRKYGFDYPAKTVVKVDGDQIPCLVGELRRQPRSEESR